ncbi:MAG: hypothetical protein ATN35_00900 [Epulopiscium sp. Nele67-Bin004]|nr:MAG: hypothetical protein ATN35_00900 [Epulopiscium sp. Nele67-Bin004]
MICNNTYQAFKQFVTTELCERYYILQLQENFLGLSNTEIKTLSRNEIKGKILNRLNRQLCKQEIKISSITKNEPFDITFKNHTFTYVYNKNFDGENEFLLIGKNIPVVSNTPEAFQKWCAKNGYLETKNNAKVFLSDFSRYLTYSESYKSDDNDFAYYLVVRGEDVYTWRKVSNRYIITDFE